MNSTWNIPALEKLYRGSMNDLRYRTPDIGSLNSLFVASRKRFARNMQFVRHLTIAPENTARDVTSSPSRRAVCVEKCRPLRDRSSAELLLRPGEGPISIAIPFELTNQDLSPLSDLLLHPGLKFLTIDHIYCELLDLNSGSLKQPPTAPVSPLRTYCSPSHLSDVSEDIIKSYSTFNPPVKRSTENSENLRMACPLRP